MAAGPGALRIGAERPRRGRIELLGILAFVVAGTGAVIVGRSAVGLAGWSTALGVLTAVPLYLIARGWRLPWWLHAGAAALPVSIVLIAVVHDSWAGAARASRYAWMALLVLAVAAWARTASRRLAVLALIAVLAVDQYLVAWLGWWGGGDPSDLMTGAFGWHNQLAICCAAGAVAGLVLAVAASGPVALLGGVACALTTAGVVASGSRSVLVLLMVAALLSLVWISSRSGWSGGMRWSITAGMAAATTTLMSSGIFFTTAGSSAVSGLIARGGGGSSVTMRFDHWRVALLEGLDHPIAGVGLSGYGRWSYCYDPAIGTSHPHNEWLLGWAEGGAIGLLPLLLLAVAAVLATIRVARRIAVIDIGRFGALLVTVLLFAHAAFDFDWAFPTLLALFGFAAGTITMLPLPRRGPAHTAVAFVLVITIVGTAILGLVMDPASASPLLTTSAATEC